MYGCIHTIVDLLVSMKVELEGEREVFKFDLAAAIVPAPRMMLEMIFGNLLDNAIKYSDPGAQVYVSLEEEGSSVLARIRDTGVGIPEEDLPQLFERFYRVDKARSRATGGSGLGLSITKEIIDLHGGEVSVSSEVGVGSTFEVRIPKAPLSRSANYAI